MKLFILLCASVVSLSSFAVCDLNVSFAPHADLVKLYLVERDHVNQDDIVDRIMGGNPLKKNCNEIYNEIKDKELFFDSGVMGVKRVVIESDLVSCTYENAVKAAFKFVPKSASNIFTTGGIIVNNGSNYEFLMTFDRDDQKFIAQVKVNKETCKLGSSSATSADSKERYSTILE